MLGGVLLGLREPHLLFDVIVHAATLAATVVVYRGSLGEMARDVVAAPRALHQGAGPTRLAQRPGLRLAALIILGSLPTALIGVLFKAPLEALFAAPRLAAGMLLVTAALLATTALARPGKRGLAELRWWHALIIGTVQGFAIIPGVSRSGSTIACALLLGVERELAARYSFLLSLPAVLGAVTLKLAEGDLQGVAMAPLAVGFVAAALLGLLALFLLIPLVRRGRLHYFAGYLVVAGTAGLLWI